MAYLGCVIETRIKQKDDQGTFFILVATQLHSVCESQGITFEDVS